MIDKELLEILACPESHQALAIASAAELAAINARIAQGGVLTIGKKPVTAALEGGLIRADRARIYPIKDGIPVLLIDEGIALT